MAPTRQADAEPTAFAPTLRRWWHRCLPTPMPADWRRCLTPHQTPMPAERTDADGHADQRADASADADACRLARHQTPPDGATSAEPSLPSAYGVQRLSVALVRSGGIDACHADQRADAPTSAEPSLPSAYGVQRGAGGIDACRRRWPATPSASAFAPARSHQTPRRRSHQRVRTRVFAPECSHQTPRRRSHQRVRTRRRRLRADAEALVAY